MQTGQGLSPLTSQLAVGKRTMHPCNKNNTFYVKPLAVTAIMQYGQLLNFLSM
jgi:hypothetical protein